MYHDLTAAAERGRQPFKTTLAERGRPTQQVRRPAAARRFSLTDGSEAVIRPVRGGDGPLLADGFTRPGLGSRRMRFLAARPRLSLAEPCDLSEPDRHHREAPRTAGEVRVRGVGIARYLRLPADPRAAEVDSVVVDDWQRRGLGTALLAQLSDHARAAGICRLTTLVAADNHAGLRLIRRANAEFVRWAAGSAEFEIPLSAG